MIQTRHLVSAMALAWAGNALADTTIEFHNSGGVGGEGAARIEISNGRLRSDSAGAGDTYMLFESGSNEFVMVNNAERSYMVFDLETVQKVADAQRQAMQQMEATLAQLPPAQREQMRSMMERMAGGAMPGKAPEPRRYERSGASTVAGYDCEMLNIYIGERLASEQCVTDPDELDIPDEDYATIRAMQQFVVDLTSQFAFMANQVMDYGEPGRDEMPIRYTLHMPMVGKTSGELKSVSSGDIDASRFEIPSGYQKQKLPDLGG